MPPKRFSTFPSKLNILFQRDRAAATMNPTWRSVVALAMYSKQIKPKRLIPNCAIVESGPANYFPGQSLEPRFGSVLGLHSILDNFELKRTHCAEQGNTLRRISELERLDHALLQELIEPFAKAFELRCAR